MPGPEATLERKLVSYAQRLGMLTFKLVSPGRRGIPDRMFMRHGGEVLFLEIKRKGQKPEPIQLKTMETMKEYGSAVIWTDDYEQGKAILTKFYTTNSL